MLVVKEQGLLFEIKKELADFLKTICPLTEVEILSLLEQPRQPSHGHLALPLFSLAKRNKTSPQKLAANFLERLNQNRIPFLKSCKALAGFINFQFQEEYLQQKLEVLVSKKKLADFPQKDSKEHWLVDFASPNAAKYMNIGHLRAAAMGQALANLICSFGFKVTTLNHLGDWGGQFGRLLWAYERWGKEYDFKSQPFSSLVDLYVRFHKEAAPDEKNMQEARQLFQKLEEGDPELRKLWKNFIQLSLENYEKYWKKLNVKHDLVLGESFYIKFLDDLKNCLKAKNLLKGSEGAKVVFLGEDSPPCLISKRDGASTYAARDLCSLMYRFEHLKVDYNIYITASDHNLHFKQIFETAGKINPKWQEKSLHLGFGMYRFKEGKMSTRQGQAIYLEDILDQAIQKVEQIIEERNPDLKNKKDVCEQVGVGALIFYDLMNDRMKDVDFEWDKVLDFDGSSGPFVQYSLVRSLSLLNKVKKALPKQFSKPLESLEEKQLAWRLIYFDEAVFQSFKHLKPHILARYLLNLAKEFNRFYASQKILGHDRQDDLLLLSQITHRVLWRGLEILNVPRPLSM